jgi:hypothetical protein
LHDAGAVHWAATQVSPRGQGWLHPPQLRGSVSMSVQPVPQHWLTPVHTGPPLHVAGALHCAPTHVLVAGQGWLQPPQFFGSVLMSVQPLPQHWSTPVQTGPPRHDAGGVHWAATQVSPEGQGWLQPPQLFGSVSMSVQPLPQHCVLPVQTGPPLHEAGGVHRAATQVSPGGQGWLHPPQLRGSVSMSVHPVRQHWPLPVQTGPPWQDAGGVHVPPTQVSPGGQARPHCLQFCGSVSVSVQPLPQHWSAPVQAGPPLQPVVATHLVARHCAPGGHFWLQPPQSSGLLVVSTQPDEQHWLPPVQIGPPLHETGAWQFPAAQLSPAGHTLVQLPQCVGATSVLTHTSPQHWSLPEQGVPVPQPAFGWQAPPMHASPPGHARPHVPQWFGSVPSSMQPPPQQLSPSLHTAPPAHDGTHSKFSQMSPFGHWPDCVQPTHSPSFTSQMGFVFGHCASRVQPEGTGLQVWVAGLQASPIGQVSGFVRQATQTPCGSSQ